MAMLNLNETTIPKMFSKELYEEKGYTLSPMHTDKIANVLFTAVSEALKATKSKEYPVVFLFAGNNQEMYAAAIIRFIPNEDESMPGHWNYVWTFDKNDIPDNARVVSIRDNAFETYFRMVANQNKFGFEDTTSTIECCNTLLKNISQWLQENAKEDEEMGVKMDGVFQARCILEDKEVVKSLEVIGETKAIIKDDAGNEV